MILNFVDEETYPEEGDVTAVDGATLNLTCVFVDADAVTSSSATVYLGELDVTSTIMPSGSVVEADNATTLKPMTAMTGGNTYVVNVTATLDGSDVVVKKVNVVVLNKKVE